MQMSRIELKLPIRFYKYLRVSINLCKELTKHTFLSYMIQAGSSGICLRAYIDGTLCSPSSLSMSMFTPSIVVNIGLLPNFVFPICKRIHLVDKNIVDCKAK